MGASATLLKAVRREEEAALAESHIKNRWAERSSLEDYHKERQDKIARERQKRLEMPLHLRTGASPIDMGCPIQYIPQTLRAAQLPVKMAVDPKWSTELKRTNDKVGIRIEYERLISGSVPGSISPE